jgi:hypothetical protein
LTAASLKSLQSDGYAKVAENTYKPSPTGPAASLRAYQHQYPEIYKIWIAFSPNPQADMIGNHDHQKPPF